MSEQAPLTAKDLIICGRYNWKGQPERLSYIGPQRYNGDSRTWHQFALVDVPGVCWCEVLESDLKSFEASEGASRALAAPTAPAPTEPVEDAVQIADAIDPFTRKQAPDHLTMGVAARLLRALATPPSAVEAAQPDCAGGMPCTDCQDKRQCQAGCIKQGEALERPDQNGFAQRHPLDVQALHELQKVMADFGGDWPDVPGEQEVVRRAKMLSRLWKADRVTQEQNQ